MLPVHWNVCINFNHWNIHSTIFRKTTSLCRFTVHIFFENEFSNCGSTTENHSSWTSWTLKNWLNSDSIGICVRQAMLKILLWSFALPWQHPSNTGYKSNFKLCRKQIVRQDVQIKIEFRANRLKWLIFFSVCWVHTQLNGKIILQSLFFTDSNYPDELISSPLNCFWVRNMHSKKTIKSHHSENPFR